MEIDPGRYLTFEYIGPQDYFGEVPGGPRIRGAHYTSVEAAVLHRAIEGIVELVLVEWKYTESYRVRVVHVLPAENDAYKQSLARPVHRAPGESVSEAWRRLLRATDRFLPMDSSVFLNPKITSLEYALRYAGDIPHD